MQRQIHHLVEPRLYYNLALLPQNILQATALLRTQLSSTAVNLAAPRRAVDSLDDHRVKTRLSQAFYLR